MITTIQILYRVMMCTCDVLVGWLDCVSFIIRNAHIYVHTDGPTHEKECVYCSRHFKICIQTCDLQEPKIYSKAQFGKQQLDNGISKAWYMSADRYIAARALLTSK